MNQNNDMNQAVIVMGSCMDPKEKEFSHKHCFVVLLTLGRGETDNGVLKCQ